MPGPSSSTPTPDHESPEGIDGSPLLPCHTTSDLRIARIPLDRDPARPVEPLEYVLSLSEAGLAEMRALIFELRPEALRARRETDVRTSLGEEPALPSETKEALHRTTQEAPQNTVKHAGAANVGLGVGHANGSVILDISDDGARFDPTESFPGHLGLKSMRERAEHLGGTPGRATGVRVWNSSATNGGQAI